MKRVLVLLSTYNGEKYLTQQIDSICSQKDVELSILVRDDGSTDGTKRILREYQKKHPSQFIIEEGENVGCRESFHWLISEAAKNYTNFDYYAFADQDDVWFEDKLISGVQSLEKINNPYKVYYCAYQMVDENLSPIPTSHRKYSGSLEEAFILQPCIGCSMILSARLIKDAAKIDVITYDIHDCWTYRLNIALGGEVIQDQNIHMYYRQHSSNEVGANQSFHAKWKRRLNSFWAQNRIRSKQAKTILNLYHSQLPETSKSYLTLLAKYSRNIKAKLSLFTHNYHSRNPLHNLLFRVAILTNRI